MDCSVNGNSFVTGSNLGPGAINLPSIHTELNKKKKKNYYYYVYYYFFILLHR